jgi:pimeloyl-ACP methyl ester carboxylesterase
VNYEEHCFSMDAVQINYAEGPDNGVPLVLLHGGSSRWQWWSWVIDPLAKQTHLFAPDLRGHGRSTWTPGHYRLFDFAADIEAFVEGVVGEPAVLLGHSLGGEVALIVAAERPDLVRAVIDEDGPLSTDTARRAITSTNSMLLAMRAVAGSNLPQTELEQRVADLPVSEGAGQPKRFGDVVPQDAIAWSADTFRQHDPAMLDAVIEFEEMAAGLNESLLRRVECPVVIFRADPERGGALTKEDADRAMAVLPKARTVFFEDCGHSIHIDATDRFVDEVLAVLARLQPRGRG